MSWLLGVTLPLLALGAGLSWGSSLAVARLGDISSSRVRRVVTFAALGLIAVPFVIALMILSVYALLFALHGVHLLAR
jgi:hypothetical protein